MNKLYFNLLTILALGSLTSSIWAASYPIELKNNYGAPVEFIEVGANAQEYARLEPRRVNKIPNGATVTLVNFLYQDSLSLRKVGGSFQDVSYIVRKIEAEEKQHINQTAVITINYSYNPLYWSLSLAWE